MTVTSKAASPNGSYERECLGKKRDSTRVCRARAFQNKRPRVETVPRDDRSSKNQPKRVDTDRPRSLWEARARFPPRLALLRRVRVRVEELDARRVARAVRRELEGRRDGLARGLVRDVEAELGVVAWLPRVAGRDGEGAGLAADGDDSGRRELGDRRADDAPAPALVRLPEAEVPLPARGRLLGPREAGEGGPGQVLAVEVHARVEGRVVELLDELVLPGARLVGERPRRRGVADQVLARGGEVGRVERAEAEHERAGVGRHGEGAGAAGHEEAVPLIVRRRGPPVAGRGRGAAQHGVEAVRRRPAARVPRRHDLGRHERADARGRGRRRVVRARDERAGRARDVVVGHVARHDEHVEQRRAGRPGPQAGRAARREGRVEAAVDQGEAAEQRRAPRGEHGVVEGLHGRDLLRRVVVGDDVRGAGERRRQRECDASERHHRCASGPETGSPVQ